MRIGMENRWGYSFKMDSGISFEQETIVAANLGRLDGENAPKGFFKNSTLKLDNNIHYLPEDIKSIMGIGPDHTRPGSVGIVWSMNEEHTLESIFYAELDQENDFYPYKIVPGKRYYVKDGEVYID